MVNHGQKPIEFKASFIKLAKYVHEYTNLTAIVWSPNIGKGVYSSGGTYDFVTPKPGTPNFIELDTNRDGVLNDADDPYLPYYPGDNYVDW